MANTVPAILKDENTVRALVKKNLSLAERIGEFIRDFLAKLDRALARLSQDPSWEQMGALQNDMESLQNMAAFFINSLEEIKAARESGEGGGLKGVDTEARSAENDRFSIKYDTENRPFVVVEEDILDGVPRKEWVSAVKKICGQSFQTV